jgi:hypothetical protein
LEKRTSIFRIFASGRADGNKNTGETPFLKVFLNHFRPVGTGVTAPLACAASRCHRIANDGKAKK